MRIDTENAFAKSAGAQEVIVVLEDGGKMRFIRLAPRGYEGAIQDFMAHREMFDQISPQSSTQILDLRSPHIALVK